MLVMSRVQRIQYVVFHAPVQRVQIGVSTAVMVMEEALEGVDAALRSDQVCKMAVECGGCFGPLVGINARDIY